jgi:hypothetical protein
MMMKGSAWRYIAILWIMCHLYIPISASETKKNREDRLHGVKSFISLYEAYKPICTDPTRNIILPRYPPKDSLYDYVRENCSMAWRRPWSIESKFIFRLLGIQITPNNYLIDKKKTLCSTPKELLTSISQLIENQPCVLRWFSPHEVCSLLSRFSIVWWHGDSLVRHMMQALFILASGDLQHGGYPPHFQHKIIKGPCGCDGQFSESLQCRDATWLERFRTIERFNRFGVCSTDISTERSTIFIWTQYKFSKAEPTCKNPTVDDNVVARSGPIFIFIEGGAHFHIDAKKAIDNHFRELAKQIYTDLIDCMDRVHVVFSGMVAVNSTHEIIYPQSHHDNVHKYNRQMALWFRGEEFQSSFPLLKVYLLDFWNITSQNVNQTSDGFHSLTDTNLVKATTTLNLMKLIADNHNYK